MTFDEKGLFHMTEAELVQVFSVAYARTLERDRVLFDKAKPQERTFMHRFAQELRREFALAEDYRRNGEPVLSLDVEYNRSGFGRKQDDPNNSDTHKWIAPDIILHERMSGSLEGNQKNRNNIFACEMKRDGSEDGRDADRLRNLMKIHRYSFAIDFYKFTSEDDRQFNLYKHGEKDIPCTYHYNPRVKGFEKGN